ncbi:ATP-binding protein [Marinobacteraceae bacterium S3BR75-40.1]
MTAMTPPAPPPHSLARYLLVMRLAILCGEAALMVLLLLLGLHSGSAGSALAVWSLYAVYTLLASRPALRRRVARPARTALALLIDLALIGCWLGLLGGYTNPLTSLLLLPLAVAVALLPLRHGLMLMLAAVAVYTALTAFYVPLTSATLGPRTMAEWHLQGMWLAFVLTAAILLTVVGTLLRRMRRYQQALAEAREERLRDEQLIALGLSAASAAHRMGTPLNTLALLGAEWRESRGEPLTEDDLALFEEQLERCTGQLRQLTEAANQARTGQRQTLSVEQWLARLRESFTLLWPEAAVQWPQSVPEVSLTVDATLDQALLNLLENAERASPGQVAVDVTKTGDTLAVRIRDQGGGLAEPRDPIGRQVLPDSEGLGIGLFLSNATLNRAGGRLTAESDSDGTRMTVWLPLNHDPD